MAEVASFGVCWVRDPKTGEESARKGPSVGGAGHQGHFSWTSSCCGGVKAMEGGGNVFVWQVDPKVFEVKLFGFYPSHFQWLQAFGQLGVLPVRGFPGLVSTSALVVVGLVSSSPVKDS